MDAGKAASPIAPPAVGIVADDLTGAGDSAVTFARAGWRSRLALADSVAGRVEPGAVSAIVTDSRALESRRAYEATASAVAELGRAGAERLFIKIDSTMRGSVADQVHGGLAAWAERCPKAFAVVCPAYPALGRTVKDGRARVDGEGVESAAAGSDPVSPVATSELAALLPGSVRIELAGDSVAGHASQIETVVAAGSRVVTIDAETDADLRAIASAIDRLGPSAVPVGSAGLAAAMAGVWAVLPLPEPVDWANRISPGERALIVASSLHEATRSQCKHLLDTLSGDQVRVFAPALGDLLEPGAAGRWIASELAAEPRLPRVILVAAPAKRLLAQDGRQASAAIVAGLATVASAVFDRGGIGLLALLGGEGARAVLGRFGAESVRVVDAIREGIPIGVIEGGRAKGLTVVTKAGGFGGREALADVVRELLAAAAPDKRTHRASD